MVAQCSGSLKSQNADCPKSFSFDIDYITVQMQMAINELQNSDTLKYAFTKGYKQQSLEM